MEHILEKISAFADQAHGDQQRKYAAERYIEHPKRVMETCKKYSSLLPVQAAVLLHDVLEDTATTKDQIYSYLLSVMNKDDAEETLRYVVELTDVYSKSAFPRMNRRTRKAKELDRLQKICPEAQTIKYADIMDNVKAIVTNDRDFAPVYLRECKTILKKLDKGHKDLRKEAMRLVDEEFRMLKDDVIAGDTKEIN